MDFNQKIQRIEFNVRELEYSLEVLKEAVKQKKA